MFKILALLPVLFLPLFAIAQDKPEEAGMDSNTILALVGGIIIAGFIGDLIFKVARIPSVVKLMGLGLLLGPVFQVVDGQSMQAVAPFVGKIALLIILFAGGLSLNLQTVISQLGKAVSLAVIAFAITFAISLPISFYLIELDTLEAIILGTLIAGTASSIVIPVVTKLSAGESLKTLLSIESALSNLFILVVVVIVCDLSVAGANLSVFGVIGAFVMKIVVSVVSAVIAGVLWSRLIGAMKDDLSYMLTLGFIFLLNYIVAELGGSGAISILFFAIMLANMERVTESLAGRMWERLGIRLMSNDYALNEFLKNISKELSFMAATFFFVYLGVLVSFDNFTSDMALTLGLLILTIVVGRLIGVYVFQWISPGKWSAGELIIALAMMPRGLATAVMAFKPMEPQYAEMLTGTEMFPFYAMIAILGSNLVMTGLVALGESRIKRETKSKALAEAEASVETAQIEETAGENEDGENIDAENQTVQDAAITAVSEEVSDDQNAVVQGPGDEEKPKSKTKKSNLSELTFSERLLVWLKIRPESKVNLDKRAVKSLEMSNLMYWFLIAASAIVSILGILMERPEVVIAGMLFSPITELVHTVIHTILTGDVYMFLKGSVKMIISSMIAIFAAWVITGIMPQATFSDFDRAFINPTVMDYLLSFCVGILLPIILLRGRRMEIFAITPVLALLLFPPLGAIGFGIATGGWSEQVTPGLLAFGANLAAISLGGLLTQYTLGLTKASASEYIQRWKEKEVEEGVFHEWFERLHLTRFLEYAGNFYARVVVIALFGIAMFWPLQTTINRLTREYETKQTIARLAEEAFEETNRSDIWSISTNLERDIVETQIKINTSKFYTLNDQKEFMENASSILDGNVVLKLVQIPTGEEFMGNAETASPDVYAASESLSDRLGLVQDELFSLEQKVPGFGEIGLKIVGYSTILAPGTDGAVIEASCLQPHELSPETETLLRGEMARALDVDSKQVRLKFLPSVYQSESMNIQSFRDTDTNQGPLDLLKRDSRLKAEILMPDFLPEDSVPIWKQRFRESAPLLSDSTRVKIGTAAVPLFSIRVY